MGVVRLETDDLYEERKDSLTPTIYYWKVIDEVDAAEANAIFRRGGLLDTE